MIAIETSPLDLLSLRFGISPLLELVMSYRPLRSQHEGKLPLVYRDKFREAQSYLQHMDLPYMDAMLPKGNYFADFITPTPSHVIRSLDDDIVRLTSVSDDVIRKNVRTLIDVVGVSPTRQHFMDDPRGALSCLVSDITYYWRTIFEPHWLQIFAILENDIMYRARESALHGVTMLLGNIATNLSWQDNAIQIETESRKIGDLGYTAQLTGDGLRLIPSTFVGDHILWQFAPEWNPMVIYGARGIGLLDNDNEVTNPPLNALIGISKARMLNVLSQPLSTGEIARSLDVTAGAISQQVRQLREAGLIESHRSGNRVYYRLSYRGEQLLNLFNV